MQSLPQEFWGPTEVLESPKGIMWNDAIARARAMVSSSKNIGVLICADATLEEVASLKKALPKAEFFSYSRGVNESSEDVALDHLLRRKDKSPNLKGLESMGLKAFQLFQPKNYDLTIVVSAGKVRPPYGIGKLAKKAIAVGVFLKEELDGYQLVLPGLSTFEKNGTFVNFKGMHQALHAAIPPVGMSRPLDKILTALTEENKKVG